MPWIAIFSPTVTQSAQQGYYPVYLFAPSNGYVYLSMNQGTTLVRKVEGKGATSALRNRAAKMVIKANRYGQYFDKSDISLGYGGRLALDYEHGHSFGKKYSLSNLPNEMELQQDLIRMLKAYVELEDAGGLSDAEDDPASDMVEERRRWSKHYKLDRNPRAAKLAKKNRPAVCEVCDLDFKARYGEIGKGYIEAHHLVPISSIPLGEVMTLSASDFALLCSNCHRMIHRMEDVADVEGLKKIYLSGKKTSKE